MNAVKMMGMLFIIAGLGSYGLIEAHGLKLRVRQINELKMALGFLEKEITYLQTPLSLALYRTAHCAPGPIGRFFIISSNYLKDRQGGTIYEAWHKALAYLQESSHLQPDDLEVLLKAATQLGLSGPLEQEKLFILMQEELKIQEAKARAEEESGRKLRAYGGFILGAAIVLLFI